MYGPAGERRLTELELTWLDGYEGSQPVRVGNGASEQFQLDVYGEVLDVLYEARRRGLPADERVGARREDAGEPRAALARARTRGSGRCAARAATSLTRR